MKVQRSSCSFFALLCLGVAILRGAEPEPPAALSFDAALARAVAEDPELQLVETQLAAADGDVEQANLRPNPVISGELENVIGTGPFQGLDGLEVTLGVRQLLETAGKRGKRAALARDERRLVAWEREARLYALRADVHQAFVAMLLAQQGIALHEDLLELAQESERETARLLEAARVPEVELSRARLAVRQREFRLRQSRRTLDAARTRLAAFWGEIDPAPFRAAGEITVEQTIPSLGELATLLPQTAPLARLDGVETQRQSAVELEQARARPDVEVFAGGRYFREEGDAALVAGVDIPWPVFDRNQGNIRAAQARLRAVAHERAAIRRALVQQLADAHARLLAAHDEVQAVQHDLQPAAERTLADTEDLYQRGQYTLLNVLESRQALFEIRETYLDALRRYAEAQAEITALTQPATPPLP